VVGVNINQTDGDSGANSDEESAMPVNEEGPAGTLDACRDGMTVIDVDGEEVGTIALIGMPHSDDERTVNGELTEQYDQPPDLPIPAPGAGGGAMVGPSGAPLPTEFADRGPTRIGPAEPDVSVELAQKLLHSGYIKIDSKGLFHRDRYASADQIGRAEDNTLHLTVAKQELVPRNLMK
jgi:hypothetical protein